MQRDEDFATAIRQRDITAVVQMMFEAGRPLLRSGFKTETELWDYKGDCPRVGEPRSDGWAEIAKDVLGFYNLRGGVLVFGIADSFDFCGATQRLDSKLVNDQLRRYLGDRIWVEYHREFIQPDQRYVGVLLIPPRGPTIERFQSSAKNKRGELIFEKGESAIRSGDSTRRLSREDADKFARDLAVPSLGKIYEVDQPYFRILATDYNQFIERQEPCREIERALQDPRAAVAAVIGIGGAGKTALGTWAALRAYDRGDFKFIVSITAKDRELTSGGIRALKPTLTTFETLLNDIADVLGFPELKAEPIVERERHIRGLIKDGDGLLYVDNLETVDDKRVIAFLDDLPTGVRAITTSRRTSVRVSVRPIDLGPLTEPEVVKFIGALSKQAGFSYVTDLAPSEAVRVGNACDRIPLAIKWALARSKSAAEALSNADGITKSGRRGEELLEFCFRRIFDAMPATERAIVEVLSLFQRPLLTEALLVGANLPNYKLLDAVEQLVEDALVQRLFDADRNDYAYTLLPITRTFVYSQVIKQPNVEESIRRRLSDYFEAKDVKDPNERLVVREVRQGREASETALVDLALVAERRGDLDGAEALFRQALQRNPRSWKAARAFAEFTRHKRQNKSEALRLYEQAAGNAPARGQDRALVFREWGMLLRDSGDPEATDLAIEKFEICLRETPNDAVAVDALARMLDRKGFYGRVIDLLAPLADHGNAKTRSMALSLLAKAYERTGDFTKMVEAKARMQS